MRPLLGIPLIALVACPAVVGDRDSGAAPVSEASLLSSERFWPYQVALSKDGSVGVLIRVEEGGVARIDFGRDGLRDVSVADTDLVERANLVRTGEVPKLGPNFLVAIGPRLADSSGPTLRAFSLETAAEKPAFVCVFADPNASSFSEIAKALAPLSERHGVTTILFPQGRVSDVEVGETLRSLGWTIPFVFDHLSEAYTRTLLSRALAPPALMLVTNEGRVLLESAWRDDLTPELTLALDAAFGGTPASASAADPL